MDSKKHFSSLAESIQSLLGFKSSFSSGWVASVCNIINTLPSEEKQSSHNYNITDANEGDASAIKIHDDISSLTSVINQLNIQRRKILNELLDLKGNIRVFCRVRPLEERNAHVTPIVDVDSNRAIVKLTENKTKVFVFDKVFQPRSSQDEVFMEVEPLIKSALDGYNACIFAYGQTGTGKTFTMEGTAYLPGIVPRSIEALFKQSTDYNHKFLFTFSMLEIYMGHLRDLLIPQMTKTTHPLPQCLSIQTRSGGDIEIENLVTVNVNDLNKAMKLYRLGCRARSTGSTESNKTSSRSHCMIRISMSCCDATDRRRSSNKLWLVDLGGSERVLKTRASGRRFEEGKAINLSLSALGDVIHSLQTNKVHIPFRNSKLTQVLKDSLGEDSKTLMLVHVSPQEEDMCETICSLSFATRAMSIHLGNKGSEEEKAEKEVAIRNLQNKIAQIEDERNEAKSKINKLNEKLEILVGVVPSLEKQPESLDQSFEEPRCEAKPEKIGSAATSLGLPRFMRPTVSSRTKSGTPQGILNNKPLRSAKRRKPKLQRAKSVSFPIQCTTESNSECSIPRTICFENLQAKSNADNETEYSHDTSESDIRMAISLEQEELARSSMHYQSQLSLMDQNLESDPTNELSSHKISHINHWLQSHERKHLDGLLSLEESLQQANHLHSRMDNSERDHFTYKGITSQSLVSEVQIDDLPVVLEDEPDMLTIWNDISLSKGNAGIRKMEQNYFEYDQTYENSDLIAECQDSNMGSANIANMETLHECTENHCSWLCSSGVQNGNTNSNGQAIKDGQNSGFFNMLKQKARIMCNSMVIGLGIVDIGLEHDFFYALIL